MTDQPRTGFQKWQDGIDKAVSVKKPNPAAAVLRPGQVLQFQRASVQRVITGWRALTSGLLQMRYNGGGDPSYDKKIDYALRLVRQGTAAVCAS